MCISSQVGDCAHEPLTSLRATYQRHRQFLADEALAALRCVRQPWSLGTFEVGLQPSLFKVSQSAQCLPYPRRSFRDASITRALVTRTPPVDFGPLQGTSMNSKPQLTKTDCIFAPNLCKAWPLFAFLTVTLLYL